MDDGLSRSALRADARENRDRVLAAARELFSASGLEVTMRQVARRAGVGPATLYRRFPTKQALLAEVFDEEVVACSTIVREAAADTDPWRGFCSALRGLLILNGQNKGFTDAYFMTYGDAAALRDHRATMLTALAALVRRAKDAGRLRKDFEVDDLVLLLRAGRGSSVGSESARAAAARRLADILIEGLSAAQASSPSDGATGSMRRSRSAT